MPRSLVSLWKRVATSGTTADGREILPQELRDVAETYKPSKYTAVIWSEHERGPGSHGTVYAARLVEDDDDLEPGQVALEAQLKPNDKLLWLNDRGEKLFSSVEITPNFANSGKAYLTGLAVTDSPASLGTQELYFSRQTNKAAYYAASVELGQLIEPEPQGELGKLSSLITSLFKRFGLEESPATPQPQTESKPPMDEATAKALAALVEQLLLVTAGIQTLIEPATTDVELEQEPIDNVEESVQDILDKAEEERAFSRRRKAGTNTTALEKAVANLDKKFSALLDAPKGRVIPRTTGASNSQKRRIV
ncbi:capsid scaffolding protein [Pseudomonas proteolytica]|uniref:GPO family capsid scaffolding protein n=1 Tax=Pseudomonas proteolytica TaxID=219574 RepID=UPI00147547F8|nr:GPO family capsid scaffolding protein [Pseudomonas proteolytica]NMZ04758.1 capsid scaffolding protein [Pseudomonas proteolytica]